MTVVEPKPSGSALYAVVMPGQLKLQIRDLRRMVGDASANVAAANNEGNKQQAEVWSAILDAARSELGAAEAVYDERFGGGA